MHANHDSAQTAVGNEHVRAAAENRHGQAARAPGRERVVMSSRGARLHEPVGATADLERRDRRERRVALHALLTECVLQAPLDGVGHTDLPCSV